MYFKSITMIGRTVKVTNTTPKRCKNLKHILGFNKKYLIKSAKQNLLLNIWKISFYKLSETVFTNYDSININLRVCI